ncbi:lysine decarboxylase-like protein, putative [Plasmodium gallinaceum]|uniref:Lysine decarboxylase-like protein, putative n=1 Tax=Plasmodium gallinaceum TaxID=5849 RepID=A0A1J1GPF3_PLAGA|nr:lysine decarboxylase-like protein, putative [Plasmodium gallinaceum]CRG93167.1 lysine decarboxylase-like protein, putative [Plasmodium gallinaceum]
MEKECESIKSDIDGEENEIEINEIYNKSSFINSRGARLIRIMSEFVGVQDALKDEGIFFTVVVFGSSRSLSKEKYESKKNDLEKKLENFNEKIKSNIELVDEELKEYNHIKKELEDLEKLKWTIEFYKKIYELSKMLTFFFSTDEGQKAVNNISSHLPKVHNFLPNKKEQKTPNIFTVAICTGGGPGFMEAANKGSKDAGGKSIGFMISLPFEKGANPYVDKSLSFKFHYFFTRKFWLVYLSLAFIILPGGFGTLDEMMEILTLKQCKKFKRDVPIVLLGKQFWFDVLNFQKLVDYGVISQTDLDSIFITDCVDEAYNFVISHLKNTPCLSNSL